MKTHLIEKAISDLQLDIAKVEGSDLRADQKRNMIEPMADAIRMLTKRLEEMSQ